MPWLRHRFKKRQKVYAQVDESGALVEEQGRVKIRYKLTDPREYTARAGNLEPLEGAEVSFDEVPDAVAPAPREEKKSAPKKTSKSRRKKAAPGEIKRGEGGVSVVENPIAIPSVAPDGVVLIFTDGACTGNPGPAGLGVVMLFGHHRREMWEYLGEATNNVAELTAILRALESVRDARRTVHIYTDSMYSIGVLALGWKARANKELVAEIKSAMTAFGDLTIFKVAGHTGFELNEVADELARRAITERGNGDDRSSGPPPSMPSSEEAPATTEDEPGDEDEDTSARAIEFGGVATAVTPGDGTIAVVTTSCFGEPGYAGVGAVIEEGGEVRETSISLGQTVAHEAELGAIEGVVRELGDGTTTLRLYTTSRYAAGTLARGVPCATHASSLGRVLEVLTGITRVVIYLLESASSELRLTRARELAESAALRPV